MKTRSKTKKTHLQRFGLFFYDHIKTTASLWMALVVFGFLSYGVFMQRQGFPNVEVPISVANGTYFVNDQSKVDAEIVKPLDEIIVRQSDVKSVKSTAGANFFSVVIEYKDGINATKAQDKVKVAVASAGFLPERASLDYLSINASKLNNKYDVLLSVRQAPYTDLNSLVGIADDAVKQLAGTSGVDKLEVLNPYKTGKDASGQDINLQQTFDRMSANVDGKTVFFPSVEIGVIAKTGTDAIHLERSLNEKLSSINSQKKFVDTYYEANVSISAGVAESIRTQIHDLQTNLLEGLAVVVVISLLLISLRAGIGAALSMTSVLLITVGILYVVGITLNTITLFALVLCLGLIVDDTTIMAEAIDAGKRNAESNRDIVAHAMKKVARASTAGTLVTMLAFAPMMFISGILGSFIRILPITIIVSLAVSLLVSLTLIPFMSRRLLLSEKSKKSHSRNPILKAEKVISDGLARMIRIGNYSRARAAIVGLVAIAISFVFLMASTVYFQKLKFDIFPSTKDSDAIMMSLTYPDGTSIDQAQKITDEADEIIASVLGPNMRDLTYLNSGSAQTASAQIMLTSFKGRDVKSPELITRANIAFKDFAKAKVKLSQLNAGPPKDDLPFRVQIYSEDTEKSNKLASDIAAYLKGRTIARQSNKTTATITGVQIAGDGDSIVRNNARREIEVQAGFDSDDVSALVTSAQKAVQDEFTPDKLATYGLDKDALVFDFGNESSNQDSFKSMLLAFPILLIVMYVLLALQFGSLLQPLLIFTAIPFSFFGVAAGLHYTDNPLSFFVMIGFFALIGIAVNNTILLTDFANQARKEGKGGFEAMALAVKARFRPLITTSLTSIVALIPLALSDPFWESLAFTLIFGLLSSTFLVIVSFPYYYLAAEYLRSKFSRRKLLSWLAILVIVVIVLAKINSKLIPLGLIGFFGAALVVRLQKVYAARL